MTWINYLMFFGGILGVIIIISLITIESPRKNIINRLFAQLVLLISFNLFVNSQSSVWYNHPKLHLISCLCMFYYPTLFYLFLISLTDNSFKLTKRHLRYLAPGMIYLIVLMRYLVMPDTFLLDKMRSQDLLDLNLVDLIGIIINLYFVFRCWSIINKNKWINNQKILLYLFNALILITNLSWMIITLRFFSIDLKLNFITYEITWIITSFYIYFFTYFIVTNSEFFVNNKLKSRYSNSTISQVELNDNMSKIKNIMNIEKPYLDQEFSLSTLSNLSGIEKFKLSLIINKFMNTSFFDLVNHYRVEEFIQLANSKKYEKFSLIGIAYESGFKSKSTFYKAFKDRKGTPPREYFKKKSSIRNN